MPKPPAPSLSRPFPTQATVPHFRADSPRGRLATLRGGPSLSPKPAGATGPGASPLAPTEHARAAVSDRDRGIGLRCSRGSPGRNLADRRNLVTSVPGRAPYPHKPYYRPFLPDLGRATAHGCTNGRVPARPSVHP